MMEKIERITRAMLRSLQPGQSYTAQLPNYAAVQNAYVTIGQVRKIDNIDLVSSYNRVDNALTVTRRV